MQFYACFFFLRVASVVAFIGGTKFSVGLSTISAIKDEWCAKIAANLNVSKKRSQKNHTPIPFNGSESK